MGQDKAPPVSGRFGIGLLGSFTVRREGALLAERDLGSRKARTLLKLLIVERGRVVPLDHIAEVLWGTDPPDRLERHVATLASRLRGVLGRDAVAHEGRGYRFMPSARFTIDVDDAEALATEAEARLAASEPSLAWAACEQALGLLARGGLLEDEADAGWLVGARAAADALMRRARRTAWQAALALGKFDEAVRVAQAATAADPLDEQASLALMLAHQRRGQPAQALRAYENLRTVLADGLGADPAPEVRALHAALLREEPPALPEPEHAAVAVESHGPALVGRDREQALLSRTWADVVAGNAALVLLVGEAGIGKTRFAGEVCALARRTGGTVVQTRCYEAERSLFLQPVADALRELVLLSSPEVVRNAAGQQVGTLADLVPEIGTMLGPVDYERAPAELERRRVFESVVRFLGSLGRRGPLLIFLDDLHHVGSATLELLHLLARRLDGSPVLLLATVRVEEGEDAIDHLGDVASLVDIGPLPDAAVTELVRRAGAGELAARILDRTRGHALFVVETLRALADMPAGSTDPPVPSSLRAAVLARMRRAGADVEELLRGTATLGSVFELPMAAALLELSVEETARRAELACKTRMLHASGATYEFANDLIREIAYHTTPLPVRVARHRRATGLLAEQPEAMAWHASQAKDWTLALKAWLRAADRATSRFANRDAERLLTMALDAANNADDAPGAARTRLARGRVREALADYRGAFEDHSAVVELARSWGLPGLQIKALRELGGDLLVGLGRPTRECIPYLEAGLAVAEATGDGPSEVDLLSRLAVIWTNRLRLDRARDAATQALTRARDLGDEQVLAVALDGLKTVSAYSGDIGALGRHLPQLERILRRDRDFWRLQWAVFESSFIFIARGRWPEAIQRIEDALAVNRTTGHTAYQPLFLAHLGWIHRSRGDYGQALAFGRQATAQADELGHPWWIAFAQAELGLSLAETGAIDEAVEHLEQGLVVAEHDATEAYLVRCRSHLAWASLRRGERDKASTFLGRSESLLEGAGEVFVHGGQAYLTTAASRLELGDAEAADQLAGLVLDAAGTAGWVEFEAAAALLRARCRQSAGDVDAAAPLALRALQISTAAGLPAVAWQAHAALSGLQAATEPEQSEKHAAAAEALLADLATTIEDDEARHTYQHWSAIQPGSLRDVGG